MATLVANENPTHPMPREKHPAHLLLVCVLALPLITAGCATSTSQPSTGAPLVADGAADARQDFADGILILLGGEGVEAGMLDLGNGLSVEIATDACALGPDPAGYMSDYNTAMKQRIREVYGVDVDAALLDITP